MADVEVKQINEADLSKVLSGNVDSILTPEAGEKKEPETDKDDKGFKKVVNTDFKWSDLEKLDDEGQEGKNDPPKVTPDSSATRPVDTTPEDKNKPGRKPSDLVSMVNELVASGDLSPYEDGDAKTIEEARELIKLNIAEAKNSSIEQIWEDKVKTYSPQIQAILQYAEKGGSDVTPLLSAISEVEKSTNFDLETEPGQENIIKEYLSVQGWSDDEIKEEIETAKDLNKLKKKAESFLPKLNQMNQQRLEIIMAEQQEREKEAEDARRNYLSTIKNTLDKDKLGEVKLTRQEKAMLWDGLTDIKYRSWSGQPTNAFFKKLEELQAGDKADYDHFLEIAYLTLNRSSFKQKLKTELNNEVTADTVRKLKGLENKKSSASEGFFDEEENKKPVIKRQSFKNPWG